MARARINGQGGWLINKKTMLVLGEDAQGNVFGEKLWRRLGPEDLNDAARQATRRAGQKSAMVEAQASLARQAGHVTWGKTINQVQEMIEANSRRLPIDDEGCTQGQR
jgi:hypothetical protein